MESITINNNEEHYKIESITPTSENILQIVFYDKIPEEYGDINVFTEGGVQCSHLPGFSTIYKEEDEGKTIYLSNDGSIWTPIEENQNTYTNPELNLTPEELLFLAKKNKRQDVSFACTHTIYEGVDVDLPVSGITEHFSLTEHDQLNLLNAQFLLYEYDGTSQIEYHADGKPYRYYNAQDIKAIIVAARRHISYNTAYCNGLNMWIKDCKTVEEVENIFYGIELPSQYENQVLCSYKVLQ